MATPLSTEMVRTVRQPRPFKAPSTFHGWKLATEPTRRISRLAKKLSSMVACVINFYKGKYLPVVFFTVSRSFLTGNGSAAQAWNRNDARAAKALSLRGQSENDLMRKAHREAARELYEHRNKNMSNVAEIYV